VYVQKQSQGYSPSMKRAVIYARVSTDKQEEDGTSLDTQVENCTRYAASLQLRVVEVFREVFTGSLYRERPMLTKLRVMARNGEFDALIVNMFDRLSRNQTHLAVLIDEMEHLGIQIECVNEKFDDTAAGQFMRSAMAFVAQVEREKIAERTMTGRRKRVLEGKLNPGWKPRYGYRWAGHKKERYEINEPEAEVIRYIFHLYADEHLSLKRLARRLTEEGIPSPSGQKAWFDSTVRRILVDPAYIGHERAFKYNTSTRRSGKIVYARRPISEQLFLPYGVAPAIVDEETFRAAQERIHVNMIDAQRNNHHPQHDLLRCGFIRCGYCKRSMSATGGRLEKEGRCYRCTHRYRSNTPCKEAPTISIKRIDDAVWEYVGEVIQDFSLVEQAIALARGQNTHAPDLHSIERSVKTAEEHQNQLVLDLAQSENGLPKLKGRARQLVLDELMKVENYLEDLEMEKQKVLTGQKQWEQIQSDVDQFLAWCLNAKETYQTATYEEKRRALRVLGIVVYVCREDDTEHDRYKILVSIPDIVRHTS
jgi:site-specific DNA recombinase